MGVGKRIKDILERRNMTVIMLADSTGIPSTTLYSMIKRDSDDEKFDILMRLCASLGVSLSELIGSENMGKYTEDIKNDLWPEPWPPQSPSNINKLVDHFNQLNDEGQDKAIERIEELTEIPKYKK